MGYVTGHSLDAIAANANELLIQANGAILEADTERAIKSLTSLAALLFGISPFTPDPLPVNWSESLRLATRAASRWLRSR